MLLLRSQIAMLTLEQNRTEQKKSWMARCIRGQDENFHCVAVESNGGLKMADWRTRSFAVNGATDGLKDV